MCSSSSSSSSSKVHPHHTLSSVPALCFAGTQPHVRLQNDTVQDFLPSVYPLLLHPQHEKVDLCELLDGITKRNRRASELLQCALAATAKERFYAARWICDLRAQHYLSNIRMSCGYGRWQWRMEFMRALLPLLEQGLAQRGRLLGREHGEDAGWLELFECSGEALVPVGDLDELCDFVISVTGERSFKQLPPEQDVFVWYLMRKQLAVDRLDP